MNSIKEIRQAGLKVRVSHLRYYCCSVELIDSGMVNRGELLLWNKYPQPKGGKTVLEVTTKDGQNIKAEAKCSKKDNYNKKLGVKICIGRLKL